MLTHDGRSRLVMSAVELHGGQLRSVLEDLYLGPRVIVDCVEPHSLYIWPDEHGALRVKKANVGGVIDEQAADFDIVTDGLTRLFKVGGVQHLLEARIPVTIPTGAARNELPSIPEVRFVEGQYKPFRLTAGGVPHHWRAALSSCTSISACTPRFVAH